MEIRFCDRCDASIPQADLDRGVARRVGGQLLCAACRLSVTRIRLTRALLVPSALLASAALGAVVAVGVLGPRLRSMERRVAGLSAKRGKAPGPEPALLRGFGALRELIRENVEEGRRDRAATVEARRVLADRFAAALRDVGTQVTVLAEEIRAIKERLARPGTGVSAPGPKPAPKKEADGEAARAAPDVDTMLTLTEDEDPGARLSALVALATSPDPRVVPRTILLLEDTDYVVRAEAAEILGRRGDERAITPLIARLEDDEVLVRDAARKALLALTGSDHGFDATDPPEVRRKAVEAFRAWDHDRRN